MGLFDRTTLEPTPSLPAELDSARLQKKTIFNYLNPNRYRLNEASLEVFRSLPAEIRKDPSMINFQRDAERWSAEDIDGASASGNSASITEGIEMRKLPHKENHGDEGDASDDDSVAQFIAIKALNSDESSFEDRSSEQNFSKPKKTVKMVELATNYDDHNKSHLPSKSQSKIENPFHEFGKTLFLIFIWLLMITFLASTDEKKIEKRQMVLPKYEPKIYNLPQTPNGTLIHMTLQAPFLPDPKEYPRKLSSQSEDKRNKDNTLVIFLRRITGESLTPNKTFYIHKPYDIDLMKASKIDFTFDIGEDNLYDLNGIVQVVILSNFSKSLEEEKPEIPITLSVDFFPVNKPIGVLFAALTLILMYALIMSEVVHRTFAAIIASTLSIALLAALNDRPTHEEIVGWIDVETILLLFSMMILVGILSETGIFDHLAVYAYRITNGQIWPLIHCLCIITCLISMLLDNVTTVLLMAPITITLCEEMDINPVPILMAIVVHANIGGCSTPVGDPPNIIITSNPTIIDSGVTFLTFTVHMLVGVAIITLTTNIHLRLIYPNINALFIHEPKDIKMLKKNIMTWERTLRNSISPFSKDADLIRETLVKKIKTLRHELKRKMSHGVVETTRYKTTLEDMEKGYPIKNKGLLIKSGIALAFILVLFFVQSIPEIRKLSLGWSALIGILFLLIICERDDMDAILHRVEWPTLLFFAAMFVLMEAVERMGFIAWIGNGCEDIIKSVSKDYRLAVAIIIILWVSALTSAFVESLPVTQMMLKIVVSLARNTKLGLPIEPLVWALAFGPGLGGNGTLVGASANVIGAGITEQHGYKMTFMDFLKFGFPIMIISVAFTMCYLLFFHAFFTWH